MLIVNTIYRETTKDLNQADTKLTHTKKKKNGTCKGGEKRKIRENYVPFPTVERGERVAKRGSSPLHRRQLGMQEYKARQGCRSVQRLTCSELVQ